MSNNGLGKIIGYWIAWILTIGWASVIITHDDIAQEYKANTWKELTIDESELSTFKEVARETRESKLADEEAYRTIDCVNYEYDFSSTCEEVKSAMKTYIDTVDWIITCYDKLAADDDLEKTDLLNCITTEKATRDAMKQFYIKVNWTCNEECQKSVDAFEYNIAEKKKKLKKLN